MQLFRNTGASGNHWIQADLEGVTSNRDGIGAIVYAITPDGKIQIRENGNGAHKKSQNFPRIHFGLGANTTVDLQVHWPSGLVDTFRNLQADQIHNVAEGTGGNAGYVLSVGNVAVNEGAGAAVFTVNLSPAPGAGESVVVSYQTQNGSAVAGSDYTTTAGTLTYTQGQTQRSVSVPIIDDATAEGTESFSLQLTSADTNTVNARVTILDDDSGGALPRQKVYTVSPCRVVDTRGADPQLSTFSGDRLAPGETVSFFVTGNLINGQGGAAICGIPPEATGVFANVVAVRPQGSAISNYLTVYPYGESRPLASTVNYPADITALANGVLVPLCDPAAATCDYDLNVYNYTNLAVHLVIDVTGYLGRAGALIRFWEKHMRTPTRYGFDQHLAGLVHLQPDGPGGWPLRHPHRLALPGGGHPYRRPAAFDLLRGSPRPGETVPFFVTGALITGQGGEADCGVPATARGVFVNVTAVRPLGSGTGGYLTLYPYGESQPTASTINYQSDATAVANGVLVPLCDPAAATCDYDLNVYNYTNLAVHLVLDVTGYLTE